jgi:molybdopterin-guanine dinucleotide biosynthesis protein A
MQRMNAAIVLVGGHSRRMGRPKDSIELGGRTLLEHVLSALVDQVGQTIVVGRMGQPVSELVPEAFRTQVLATNDRRPDGGPLEGVRSGLAYLNHPAIPAFVCGCDTPLITPRFIQLLFSLAEGFDAVAPHVGGRVLPLPAVYRGAALPIFEAAIEHSENSLWRLHRQLNSRPATESEMRMADPNLDSLVNVNDEAALQAAFAILQRRQGD